MIVAFFASQALMGLVDWIGLGVASVALRPSFGCPISTRVAGSVKPASRFSSSWRHCLDKEKPSGVGTVDLVIWLPRLDSNQRPSD